LTDEETIGQLAVIRWEIDSQGRIKIESKERARGRGELSPDRADALMLAVCKPPPKYEYTPALPQQRSGDHLDGGPELDDFISDFAPRRRRELGMLPQGALARYFRRNRGAWSGGRRCRKEGISARSRRLLPVRSLLRVSCDGGESTTMTSGCAPLFLRGALSLEAASAGSGHSPGKSHTTILRICAAPPRLSRAPASLL